MAYVLISLGLMLAWLDYLGSGNLRAGGDLLWQEWFNANPPFWKWFGALIIVGAMGYIPEMEPIAVSFLILIMLAIVLSHGSGFSALIKGA